jgi:hypothetical protein
MASVKTYVWLSQEKRDFISDNPKVMSLLYDLGLLPEEISARVRGYIEEERERCAKIAEAWAKGARSKAEALAFRSAAEEIRG